MLFYDFKNYEEFKEIFGIIEHGNGQKSRKNKILLALYKDRQALKRYIRHLKYLSDQEEYHRIDDRIGRVAKHADSSSSKYVKLSLTCQHYRNEFKDFKDDSFFGVLKLVTLVDLKNVLRFVMTTDRYRKENAVHTLSLCGLRYYSDSYETDDMLGLCEDGTLSAIRYRNIERNRVFKMKAGKMLNHLISCNTAMELLPEEIKIWFSEQWVADWIDYARYELACDEYKLHVDDNFSDIYSSEYCAGYDKDSDSFGSCMVDDDNWRFYRDAVDAKAAYLTDDDDMIVARCIIYTNVTDQDGKKWRLAERQYSEECDPYLQRQLISALIRDGHIDGYKKIGASCSDSRGFVDNSGNSLHACKFKIPCHLEDGDSLSYQDSFKWYNYSEHYATNYAIENAHNLATTDGEFNCGRWSDYNDDYIDEDDAVYVETRNDWFRDDQVVSANVYNEYNDTYTEQYCLKDDCLFVDNDYYYAGDDAEYPEDFGLSRCPECGEVFIKDDGCYSEYLEEEFCCSGCCEDAETRRHEDNGEAFSEWDTEWFDEDDVICARSWDGERYVITTISIDSFNELVQDYEATEYNGEYFIDDITSEGEPVHCDYLRMVA